MGMCDFRGRHAPPFPTQTRLGDACLFHLFAFQNKKKNFFLLLPLPAHSQNASASLYETCTTGWSSRSFRSDDGPNGWFQVAPSTLTHQGAPVTSLVTFCCCRSLLMLAAIKPHRYLGLLVLREQALKHKRPSVLFCVGLVLCCFDKLCKGLVGHLCGVELEIRNRHLSRRS